MRMISYLLKMGLAAALLLGCKKNVTQPAAGADSYFPPIGSNTWASTTPESLGWNTAAIPALYSFLQSTNTRAFLVLKDGRLVIEQYFGTQITGAGAFGVGSTWYWASAGKTLTASLIGVAVQEGKLKLDRPSSTYLGTGWSSLTPAQEQAITVWHHLTMTTGLDDGVANSDCTDKACLQFKAAAGTRWAYHNAPYTILDRVVEGATGQTFANYFASSIRNKIGMDGSWIKTGDNNVYYSTARSMTRFGLLILNNGKWENEQVLKDAQYVSAMISTSQNLNRSYGYLWWLNGKANFMVPGLQFQFNGSVSPAAPTDMVAAMGKNGQYINIVPSQRLVVVRMGDNPDNSPVSFTYQNQIWEQLNQVLR